jgi:hypothetical protein
VAVYEDLPSHHLLAVRNIITTTNDESYHGSASELPPTTSHGYAEWDFSDVPDPVMFQRFLDTTDYWFGYSNDSSAGSYNPARECFVVVVDDQADGANAAGAGDGEAPRILGAGVPQNPGLSAPPTSPVRGADINMQQAQARELEPKLAEEYRAVRLLRASITGEASARGERACELGKQARERINADFDVNNPNTPPRASQKLITAATLLRPCPPLLRPRRRTCTARRMCSASRIRQQGSARDDGDAQGPEASVYAGGAAGQPANQGRTPVRERILDTRGHVQDGDALNVINACRTGNTETRAVVAYHC